jgi:peptidyl-prolyl cis-trans isomerase A (cyclophilin A)
MKLLLVLLLPALAVAFQPPALAQKSSLTALFSARRDVLATSAAALVSTIFVDQAFAEGESGKIVQFTIKNLDDGSSGIVKIQLRPDLAPKGAARFEELTSTGFWNGCRFFRVIPGFIAQFGITGDPEIQSKWRSSSLKDDPVMVTNSRGTVVFATSGPNTRTTQIFINTNKGGNAFLDKQGFSPFGEVIEGMDIVDKFYAGYGEGAPSGKGPNQGLIQAKGNAYLEPSFPKLSYIADAKFL